MREYNFSAGHRSHGQTSSCFSSHSSHPSLQRKRTLDEFPMEHSRQDTHQMFQERRISQARQRQNLLSTTGESKQLSSYSRKRFETALTIKGERSLPPPTPEEKTLFWEEVKPAWAHVRHYSASTPPVSNPIYLSPRPGSGPPAGSMARGPPKFNHLRGNNSAYPTIRRILKESNAEYRVVCPSPVDTTSKGGRSSVEPSVASDCLLVPLEDHASSKEDEEKKEEVNEDRLHAEMKMMAKLDDEREDITTRRYPGTPERQEGERRYEKSATSKTSIPETKQTAIEDDEDDDEDKPSSPWYCWVDDATVSSITKSEPELTLTSEATPTPSPVPEMVGDRGASTLESPPPDKGKLSVPKKQSGKISPLSIDKRRTPSPDNKVTKKKSATRGKKRGGKRSTPEPVEEIVELPPTPPPPVAEEVEVVPEIEEIPEPVLPSYICPSSVIKSSQAEIKLWLQKSSFSAANRLLPIY